MAKINSRNKGSKNERELAKWFEEWTGYEFSRVPSSGGLRWGRTLDTVGDIICSDKKHVLRFNFSIETKFHSDINFEHLLLDVKNIKIMEFWEQAREDGKRGSKLPLLFMRYNGMPKQTWFVALDYSVFREAKLLAYAGSDIRHIRYSNDKYSLVIMNSNDFKQFEYKRLHKAVKALIKRRYGKKK